MLRGYVICGGMIVTTAGLGNMIVTDQVRYNECKYKNNKKTIIENLGYDQYKFNTEMKKQEDWKQRNVLERASKSPPIVDK